MVFLYESMKSQPKSLANVSREIQVLVVAAGTAAWGASVLAYPIEVAMLALTVATLTMLVLKTWVAPACAVALLPLVIPMSPVSKFPLLVAMISASAAGIGLVIQRWVPCDIGIAPQHQSRSDLFYQAVTSLGGAVESTASLLTDGHLLLVNTV